MPIRVLVVSERSDRTGAPVQLATLLDGIREHLDMDLTILVGTSGNLAPSFDALADSLLVDSVPSRALRWLQRRVPSWLAPHVKSVRSAALRRRIGAHDVVYVNSLLSTELAEPFAGMPTIVHVHEIGTFADSSGARGRALLDRAGLVIAASNAVLHWLLAAGVDGSRIRVVPGSVPPQAFDPPARSEVEQLRARVGASRDTFVVSSIGWFGAMKGSDRFVNVAAAVHAHTPESRAMRLVWVGGDADTQGGKDFARALASSGVGAAVACIDSMEDLRPLYGASDVVLVPSREESLSLVALEAAAQGCPVVAYPGAGGPDELADEGVLVLCGDQSSESMAQLLHSLEASPAGRTSQGATGRDAVRRHHAATDAQQAVADIVRSMRNSAPANAHGMFPWWQPGSSFRASLHRRFPRARELLLTPIRLIHARRWRAIHRRVSVADRQLLEQVILPALRDDPRAHPILFVGVGWYTADYPKLMDGAPFVTIDIDPSVARYGSSDHRTLDLRDAAVEFGRAAFGSVVCNGVFGHGTDSPEAVASAVTAIRSLLCDDGVLVVGWNDIDAFRPPDIEHAARAAGFVPGAAAGLDAWRTPTSGDLHHVYDVYRAPSAKVSE